MNWESGNYVATLNTKDKFGTPIEIKEYFTVYDLKSKVVPANTPYFSVVEKEMYQPNDTAKVFVGTAGDKLRVLVELERNGKIETAKWLTIKNLHNITFKILEADRGDIHCHLTFVKNNRLYTQTHAINVPWSNKDLKIEYQTFRDKLLPGQQEEWRIKISGPKKEKIAAEMVAAMYDASLDQFAANSWYLGIYPNSYPRVGFNSNWGFQDVNGNHLIYDRSEYENVESNRYWELIFPNLIFGGHRVYYNAVMSAAPMQVGGGKPTPRAYKAMSAKAEDDNYIKGARKESAVYMVDGVRVQAAGGLPPAQEIEEKISTETKPNPVQPRTNLKETVFFLPNLMTDAEGNVIIKFTMNEALTRWKFLGMAHTQDLKFALTQKEIVTQKELMVLPNPPRFMREGDTFEFTAKVSNLSEKAMNGTATLELFDAVTNQPINTEMSNNTQSQAFSASAGQSARLAWTLKVPFGKINALTWRITATSKNSPPLEGSGEVLAKAIPYIDREFLENYNRLKVQVEKGQAKWDDDHLDGMSLHYLYARSFFIDNQMSADVKKAADYYLGQAEKYWTKRGLYEQGLLTLALDRMKKGETTGKIIKSFKERALNNEEMGMYWKSEYGYNWNELPIETHALMIEVFKDVAKDEQAVDDLKTWLLKNKQTNNWKTTKATASAVYALLMSGNNWLLETKDVKIAFKNATSPDPSKGGEREAGTGYFKTELISPNQGEDKQGNVTLGKVPPLEGFREVSITNPNNVVAWGAMYWQYFEDLDKIKDFKDTPLKIVKQLFKEENSDKGSIIKPVTAETKLNPGDKLKVRIELRVDRNMEYVHMKDTRASGFEPINVLSQYKWQGGLGYYENTRDAATNFFFDYLPKGTYVFEYPLFVNHKGDFSNGITTIQCMYAPEFTSHSEGLRVKVGE
jgi:uncharacterized protein YfaS (alpha-2-macroglobulin family)